MHNNSSHGKNNTAVLIVAAGRGNRAPGKIPKQYREIEGQMVLSKTVRCFAGYNPIIVVINEQDERFYSRILGETGQTVDFVTGGSSRTASVKVGLAALLEHNPKTVLIHDGARPFVTPQVIASVISALQKYPAVVPALPIVDAVKTLGGEAVDREQIRRVQTPQGFQFAHIYAAYQKLPNNANHADDIEVAKLDGLSIGFCKGDENNIKLTYAEDFTSVQTMISVAGMGYDVHKTCDGNSLWLCGVNIDAGFSLKGHSDADVGLHAITDAILGAICEGDIGDHFPPSDLKWKGAASNLFLEFAKDLVLQKNGIIDRIDVTLICEKPKIKPHRLAMREAIAKILRVPPSKISVKATTTEGLGFTGREEGITAQAIVSIRLPCA